MKKIKELTNSKVKKDLIKGFFLFFVISTFAVISSLIVFSSFGTSPTETQISSISDLWNLLLGLPVTAAGAIIAIILAQKSIDISQTQEKLEKQNLSLSRDLAEYEFKQEISRKWEESIEVYELLNTGIENLSGSLAYLFDWQKKPKNYLSLYGAELSSIAKGNVQEAIDAYVDSSGSADLIKKKLVLGFNCHDLGSLSIDNGALVFDEEENKNLAYQSYSEFYDIVQSDVISSLDLIESSLRKLNKNSITRELWVRKFNDFIKTDNFMLSRALKHVDEMECYFNITTYKTPLSAIEFIKEIKEKLQGNLTSLYYLTSQSPTLKFQDLSILTLLDIIPCSSSDADFYISGLALKSTTKYDEFSPPLFWDGLEPQHIVTTEQWYSRSCLFFRDIIRLLPNKEDILEWSSIHFDLKDHTKDWIKNNLCFDIEDLFISNKYIQPYGIDNQIRQIDFNNDSEDHEEEIYTTSLGCGWNRVFFYSDEYKKFLSKCMSSLSMNLIYYDANDHYSYLSHVNRGDWKDRVPKCQYDIYYIDKCKEDEILRLNIDIQQLYVQYEKSLDELKKFEFQLNLKNGNTENELEAYTNFEDGVKNMKSRIKLLEKKLIDLENTKNINI